MADRLLQPIDVFAVERAAALERLVERERLIVVDHQRDIGADALAHRVHGGDVGGERRIAEPQLDGAEAARQQLLGLGGERAEIVHQAKTATVVGRDRARLGAEQAAQRLLAAMRERIPAGDVEAGDRHAHDALHADQREAARELAPTSRGGSIVSPLVSALDFAEQAHDRWRRRAQIAEQIRSGR